MRLATDALCYDISQILQSIAHHELLIEHEPSRQTLWERHEIHVEQLDELLVLKARLDSAREISVLHDRYQ